MAGFYLETVIYFFFKCKLKSGTVTLGKYVSSSGRTEEMNVVNELNDDVTIPQLCNN